MISVGLDFLQDGESYRGARIGRREAVLYVRKYAAEICPKETGESLSFYLRDRTMSGQSGTLHATPSSEDIPSS
jgi:hypothetical protein